MKNSNEFKYISDPGYINKDKWKEFVLNHKKGSIFQTPEIFEIYKKSKNYIPVFIACINNNDEIRGLLVSSIFSEKKGVAGKLTARSIVIGGPLLSDEVSIKKFLEYYDNEVGNKAVYTRLVNLFDNDLRTDEMEGIGYIYKEHLNYVIDLSQSEDKLWDALHNTRRRQIKRGLRRGIKVEISYEVENLSDYYQILKGTYDSAGLPLQGIDFFENAYKLLSPLGEMIFFSAYDEDKLIGHRIVLAFNYVLHDWFAGDIPEARDKYTNDVLVWEVLKWGSKKGFRLFDFGGAGEPGKEYGVRDFKKKFGGKLVSNGNYMKVYQTLKYNLLQKAIPLYRSIKKRT